jgi:hypothetical protein
MSSRFSAALLLLTSLVATGGAPARAQTEIFPTVDCYTVDPATGMVTAWFGYVSAQAAVTRVPPGALNYFEPLPSYAFQPEYYQPGLQLGQVPVTMDPADFPYRTWFLLGRSVTIDLRDETQRCRPNVCLDLPGGAGLAGPPGPLGPPGPPGSSGPAGIAGAGGAVGASAAAAGAGCRTVTGSGMAAAASATCAPGEVLLGGGGTCSDRLLAETATWSAGQLQASYPASLTAWTVVCRLGDASAHALCCPDGGGG